MMRAHTVYHLRYPNTCHKAVILSAHLIIQNRLSRTTTETATIYIIKIVQCKAGKRIVAYEWRKQRISQKQIGDVPEQNT